MELERMQQILHLHGIPTNRISFEEMYTTLNAFGYDVESTHGIRGDAFNVANFSYAEEIDEIATTLHSHDYAELILFLDNANLTYQIGTEQYIVNQGDLLMILPNVLHKIIKTPNMPTNVKRIILHLDLMFFLKSSLGLGDITTPLFATAAVINLNYPKYEFVARLFKEGLNEQVTQAVYWKANQSGIILLLISNIFRIIHNEHKQIFQKHQSDLMQLLVKYVDDNYTHKLTLDDVAEHFFVSKSTITHMFRNKLDTSFYNYLTNRRLTAARAFILADTPLNTIYQQVGFADYQTFYRAFKQKYGISPKEYRTNNTSSSAR